ncbi:TonB-dependent receptor plug domain-containing protein [Proteiniphilum acetatigenes]|uniref:TonB-dependent receptor plug domain-containing protein n=1 Tax=Proteiniphilum acetatigenes TaxID=294710 RepID=UPI000360217D|nr:TonB-dependent receptor [Proteiniphilum acetatigenes]
MNKNFFSGIIALFFAGTCLYAQDSAEQSYDLDEVVVTATRMGLPLKSIPQKVEIIDSKKIATVQADNAADLLKRTVNLDIIQYPGASSAVGMRGFSPSAHNRNYTLVLIDGKPAGTTNLTSIPTDFIERIEVVKGPYSVLYGSDAMGGVINIITRRPGNTRTGNISLSAGNFGQTNFNGYASGGVSDNVSLALGFSRKAQDKDYRIGKKNLLSVSETEELILDKKSYGDIMTNSQYQINQFMGKLNIGFNDKWSADLSGIFVTSNDIEMPGNYWHSEGLSKKDFDRTNTTVDIRRATFNNTLLISPYYSVYNESNYDNNTGDGFINYRESVRQYGLKLSDTHTWGAFQLIGGIDLDAHNVSTERFTDKMTPTSPYRPNHNNLASSVFAQGAYTKGNLFVNAGLRYNYTKFTLEADDFLGNEKKSNGYSNFNPSVGIKYFLTPMLNLHASAGNAFYVPDAYKMAGRFEAGGMQYRGNENLKAETSTSFDFGMNISNNEWLNIDFTYFHAFYTNKIVNVLETDETTNETYYTFDNADKGRMNGLEIMFSSDIAKALGSRYSFELYAGFTHLFNDKFDEIKDKGTPDEKTLTKDMLYVRRNTGNFGITFDNNHGFVTRLNARYIGKRLENDWMVWANLRPDIKPEDYYTKGDYETTDQILQHSAHLVFDYSAYYNVTPQARIGISVSNLFDENYSEKDGYNMPGRSIMGSFSYSF